MPGFRMVILCFVLTGSHSAWAIEPWRENPWYWSHHGQPVLLVGGSDDDNLFQWPREQLLEQLDRIAAAGGNVVRNTMSDRKDRGFEVYPFLQLPNGKYDLRQWNSIYWDRLETFLHETSVRNIFVQIEVWDRFDYTDNRASDPRRWQDHPYNPPNNITYSRAETNLLDRYPDHPGQNKQPFFFSTPDQRNIRPLLEIQSAFVHKLLDHTLEYDHVLYCIDNETKAEPEWASYWTALIRRRATQHGRSIAITEMWDDWDLRAERHLQTFDHPDVYDFVDVSQNNHNRGQRHWDNLQFVRNRLSERPRPMNTTKTYGADGNKFGHSDQDAIERFWRHLLGGAASIRFHRPDSGLGIGDKAVACLQSVRRMEASVPIWNLSPAQSLLGDREPNEAYAAATPNHSTIVIFFPAGASRSIDLQTDPKNSAWQANWIDIDQGRVIERTQIHGRLVSPPTAGNAVVVLRSLDQPMLGGEFFECEGRRGFAFYPAKELRKSPQPWVLYAPTLLPNYPDEHERWLHNQLLQKGIAVAGIDVGEAYGSPQSVAAMNGLYRMLTREKGFSETPCLLGRSRGGLWVTAWAAHQPQRIAALAGIYPVFDLSSYPGLKRAAPEYKLSEDELSGRLDEFNPLAHVSRLARVPVPAYLIHGTQDSVVPIEQNARSVKRIYAEQGAESAITLNEVAGQGHNYWPGFFSIPGITRFPGQTRKIAAMLTAYSGNSRTDTLAALPTN